MAEDPRDQLIEAAISARKHAHAPWSGFPVGAAGIDIAAHRECEHILTPSDIANRTGSHLGALYGPASNKATSAFLRQRNRDRRIRGLYFAGGSVHPGGGIPLCLLSGRITHELMKRHDPQH